MSSLTELLTALGSPDPSVRIPAEEQVNRAKQGGLGGFLCSLLEEFRDESKPLFARNMAGTLLKNAVAPNLRETAARRALEREWKNLPVALRTEVKQCVLSTLGSPKKDIQNVAANIIGNLSRIELPAGEWPDLMDILISATESQSEFHQVAALTAIGYVCEEGHDHEDVEAALINYTGGILNAVVCGMNSGKEEVCYCATNALCNAMEFIHDNMQQQNQRDLLVDTLCRTVASSHNSRTREKAMESLVKVADMYYSTLPNYIDRLHAITTGAIFGEEEGVALQAMLFWISICETELDMKESADPRCLFYAQKGASMLVNICLQTIVRQEEGQEEGDWNIAIAGGKLLQSLAMCIQDPVVDLVMPFVYSNIEGATWREKEAAVLAFGCILNGPNADKIQDTVAQAVPGLLQYIRHDHPLVADTAGWVLATVCELFGDVFLLQPWNLQQLINIVTPMIGEGTEKAIRGCHIVHNLSLTYEEEDCQPTNELSRYFAELLNVLLLAIDKGVDYTVKSVAQEALNALIDAAAVDCLQFLNLLVPELHKRIYNVLGERQQGQVGEMEASSLLGLLCGSLGSTARKLMLAFNEHLQPSMEIVLKILENPQGTVLEEVLTMLGSFAHAVKQGMAPYLDRITGHVVKALQCVDEPDLVTVAVGTVGDLSLGVQKDLAPYVEGILGALYGNLQNPEVDRCVKCIFLNCIGDIVLNVGEANFAQYVNIFMPFVHSMFEQSCGVNVTDDPDNEEYVMSLWESISTLYTSVCQSFKGNEIPLAPYLQNMLQFVLYTAPLAKSHGYVEVFIAIITVIGDMASVLKSVSLKELRQQAQSALLSSEVVAIVKVAAELNDGRDGFREQVRWVESQLQQLSKVV
ncbi:importin beta-1 subunit, putative [Trypanosoma equiperdum]|uniref:Importin beta-1 subunit, putative n=2 Tax=Trypanozoon TaxID=39700 RepID=Q38BV5_TRYB2|nr:importin subunit beta-1 [Trypanosoma brucei brucei TREU927]EAN77715.1 importin beta-1 subunit, putative [Trypanosoma brucei brucei TREU927]SCU72535.1 importin beta-1 subunit, putative [Trypanosoma equiperdum]